MLKLHLAHFVHLNVESLPSPHFHNIGVEIHFLQGRGHSLEFTSASNTKCSRNNRWSRFCNACDVSGPRVHVYTSQGTLEWHMNSIQMYRFVEALYGRNNGAIFLVWAAWLSHTHKNLVSSVSVSSIYSKPYDLHKTYHILKSRREQCRTSPSPSNPSTIVSQRGSLNTMRWWRKSLLLWFVYACGDLPIVFTLITLILSVAWKSLLQSFSLCNLFFLRHWNKLFSTHLCFTHFKHLRSKLSCIQVLLCRITFGGGHDARP